MEEIGFEEATKNFNDRVLALARTLPALLHVMTVFARESHANHTATLEKYGEKQDVGAEPGAASYRVPVEHLARVKRSRKRYTASNVTREVLSQSLVTTLITQFDVFLGNLLRAMFAVKLELLNSSDRQVTYSMLAGFGTIERATEYFVEKEVESVLRCSHTDQIVHLEKKLNMPLRKDLEAWPAFVELTERRNLFTHTDGIVSSQYLDVCKLNSVNGIEGVSVGSRLSVSPTYFRDAYRCALEIGIKLGQASWRKLQPNETEAQDRALVDLTYDLLVDREYQVAVKVLELANEVFLRKSSARDRLICMVNLAQAYKWSGDDVRCRQTLESEDWTALGDEFKLAHAVLVEDFDTAARNLRSLAGANHDAEARKELRFALENWPLYQRFRKTSEFREVFLEIFGESSETVDTAESAANGVLELDSPPDGTDELLDEEIEDESGEGGSN